MYTVNLVQPEPRIKSNLKLVDIVADVAFYCSTQDETAALPARYTAEKICTEFDDSNLGVDESRHRSKLKADIFSLIAMIVKLRGKEEQAQALQYINRIIEIREEELKDIPPSQWTELQGTNIQRELIDKALTLCYADRVEESAQLYERAEEYYKSVGNDWSLNHIGIMYLWVLATCQKKEEARDTASTALRFMTEKFGDDNPLAQQSRYIELATCCSP
ncbi:hypothetical protein B0J13DRAFT_526243 [Dactylonectria estremocensis]|uniref:Uncharacterized protein n=1 Tax=Dactylonectria estremocensis TaxID=1079267 RepID=A0A9P9EQR7_9HYPO|nr:hypothetical protein B0J13DRAFT_526243 [Dactylonectria estremocensis]